MKTSLATACLRCGFINCLCDKMNPEERCPNGCGHSLGVHSSHGCYRKNGHDEYCSCGYVPLIVRDAIRADTVLAWTCATHRRYQAKRKPTTACEGCWRLWIKVHP